MPRRLLTNKRKKWIGSRTTALKGEPLRHDIKLQDKYVSRLEGLAEQMIQEMDEELRKLLETPETKATFAQDASLISLTRILLNKLERKYLGLFKKVSQPWAESMINDTDRKSKSAMHSSLQKLSGGLSIKTDFISGDMKETIKAAIAENVDLIRSIPQDYLRNVKGAMFRNLSQPEGQSFSGLKDSIGKLLSNEARKIKNKAKNIALDQTRKVYNNLNAQRMEKVGVKKFVWRHAGGSQQPRAYHRDVLNGKVFSLDDPPVIDKKTGERGLPGHAINCKCYMEPVIEFEDGEEQE